MDYYNKNNTDSYNENRSYAGGRKYHGEQEERERNRYDNEENRYGNERQRYGEEHNRYGEEPRNRYGEENNRYGEEHNRCGDEHNRRESERNDYGDERNRFGNNESTYGTQEERRSERPSYEDRPQPSHNAHTSGNSWQGRKENENEESGGIIDRALKAVASDVYTKAEEYLPPSVVNAGAHIKDALQPQLDAAARAAAPHLRKAEGDFEEMSGSSYGAMGRAAAERYSRE